MSVKFFLLCSYCTFDIFGTWRPTFLICYYIEYGVKNGGEKFGILMFEYNKCLGKFNFSYFGFTFSRFREKSALLK